MSLATKGLLSCKELLLLLYLKKKARHIILGKTTMMCLFLLKLNLNIRLLCNVVSTFALYRVCANDKMCVLSYTYNIYYIPNM